MLTCYRLVWLCVSGLHSGGSVFKVHLKELTESFTMKKSFMKKSTAISRCHTYIQIYKS